MKNFNINIINSCYIEQLVTLEQECFSTPWSYTTFYETLNSTNTTLFGAIAASNHLVGYVGVYNILKEGYITNIAVLKKYRNCGVASKLLKEVINYSIKNNMLFLTLEVRKSNLPAISLYEKFNFENVGTRKNFYIKPLEDALIYTLDFVNTNSN